MVKSSLKQVCKKVKLKLVILILVLVLISFLIVIIISTNLVLAEKPVLKIVNLSLCVSVDKSYVCDSSDTFKKNETVYILFVVKTSVRGNNASLVSNYRLIDKNGYQVYDSRSNKNQFQILVNSNKTVESVTAVDAFVLIEAWPGRYSVHLDVLNPTINKEITKNISFDFLR